MSRSRTVPDAAVQLGESDTTWSAGWGGDGASATAIQRPRVADPRGRNSVVNGLRLGRGGIVHDAEVDDRRDSRPTPPGRRGRK